MGLLRRCERSEAIQKPCVEAVWIASSQGLLAMTSLGYGRRLQQGSLERLNRIPRSSLRAQKL